MEEKHTAGFVINDRRGQKKEPESKVISIDTPVTKDAGPRTWKDVGYLIAEQQIPTGPPNHQGQTPMATIIMGRAVGLRSDGSLFVADWAFSPLWPAATGDWTQYARKRLETFLHCDCKAGQGACSKHKVEVQQWMNQDSERLNYIASQPVPESIEVMIKADQARARQPRIVAPRG